MNMKYLLACGVAAVSIGTAMADPKPTVFPHGIAGSSNVMTSAGAVQGTLSDTVSKAQGSVQQSTANQPNGYAKPDASGNVTLPVTGSVEAAPADASGDTVSAIAATAKSGSALAATSVQKTQIGAANGVAPLDSNASMSAPVSGDSSASPVLATGTTTARALSSRFSDTLNVKDFGAKLDGTTADQTAISSAFVGNTGNMMRVPGGTWPSQTWWPSTTGSTKFVEATGYLSNPPNTSVTDYGINLGVYNFGNGVTSLTHGGQYFPSSAMYSRVTTGSTDTSYDPMVSFRQILDGKSANTQGNVTVETVGITTKNSTGYATNRFDKLFSMGNNYSGSFDVNHWHRTQTYGTNDAWDNIQEFGESVSFFCPPSPDAGLCPGHYINEEDFGGYGNDKAETAYDPTASTRKMFWLTTNTVAAQKEANSRWKASAVIQKYQLIVVTDATNKPWMFYGLPTGYVPGGSNNASTATTGTTQPTWVFTAGSTVVDGGVTWKCAGPFTYDVGSIFRIGGSNNPSSGWIERIGTVLSEETDYIYNAAIDMSKASFDPSVPYKVFGRLQKDMYLDMTADGTKAGQNNHLLGYDSASNTLTYKVNGKSVATIDDTGDIKVAANGSFGAGYKGAVSVQIGSQVSSAPAFVDLFSSGNSNASTRLMSNNGIFSILYSDVSVGQSLSVGTSLYLGTMTKAAILALSTPSEGQKVFDSDDHEEVTYRCPTASTCGWFPVQYGAALSK